MIALEDEIDRQTWDDRWWTLSLKSDKVFETYEKLSAEKDDSDMPLDLDTLPPERLEWLRATRDE